MVVQIQKRRDTAANWTANNPTLAAGECGYETDTGKMKIGDGATAWNSLAYFGSTWDKHNILAAGTQTANTTGTVVFSNSNGVTFGMNNSSVITASVAAGAGSVNFSAGTTSGNLGSVVFSNSNGVSFGLNGSTITASHNALTSQSNQALSAANGSFAFQTATFANSNGVSFSTGTQGIYATVATNYAASNHSHGNPTLALTNISGTTASASNGLTLSLSAAAGAADGVNIIAAGTQTANTTGTVIFSNSNNVTFGMSNNSRITAEAAVVISAGAGEETLSAFTFSNDWNVSFGINGGEITATASVPAISRWVKSPIATVIGNAGANSRLAVGLLEPQVNVYCENVRLAMSAVVTTTNNTSSAYHHLTVSAVFYTQNGQTLSSFATGTKSFSTSWASNGTDSLGGPRYVDINMGGTTLTPGRYYLGYIVSTTNSATNTSTATTALNCNYQMIVAGSQGTAIIPAQGLGLVTNSSGGLYNGQGVFSANTNATRATIAISDIVVSGQSGNLGNAWVELN